MSVRVFSRNKAKDDLLDHVFRTWKENRDLIMTAGPPAQSMAADPVALSQEAGDFDDDRSTEDIFYQGMGGNDDTQNDSDDDASVHLGDDRGNAAQMRSPHALVSPDRKFRKNSN